MQLKLCGNHSLQDTKLAVKSKADYIGFVFAESKRRANPNHVRNWLEQTSLRQNQQIVGVFVNPTLKEISEVVKIVPLDIIQLHGNESPEQVALIKNMFSINIWKTIHHENAAIDKMNAYKQLADAYLIDNKNAKVWGGTGMAFDWTFVPDYLAKAHSLGKPCFIAGGVNVDNVEKLVKYNPDGIDLASGVETNRQKDEWKILQLQKQIEQYEHHLVQRKKA